MISYLIGQHGIVGCPIQLIQDWFFRIQELIDLFQLLIKLLHISRLLFQDVILFTYLKVNDGIDKKDAQKTEKNWPALCETANI